MNKNSARSFASLLFSTLVLFISMVNPPSWGSAAAMFVLSAISSFNLYFALIGLEAA